MRSLIPAPLRPLLTLLFLGFALFLLCGVVLLRQFQSATVNALLRPERAPKAPGGQARQIITVPDCVPSGSWSAFPEHRLSVESVSAYACGDKLYLMLPALGTGRSEAQ